MSFSLSASLLDLSRAEAKNILLKNPFFAAWHPDVLDLYVNYAMYEGEDGQVWLKMNRFQVRE